MIIWDRSALDPLLFVISLEKLFATGYTKHNILLKVVNKELESEILYVFFSFLLISFIGYRPNEACRGRSDIFYESVGRNFLRCLEERSIPAARTSAWCNLYFRHRKHVRRISRASRRVFQAPYINPLFNTPLSARPSGKEEEELVAGEDGGERRPQS